MKRKNLALLAAAALSLASGVVAQQPAPNRSPPPSEAPQMRLSDADLEKFADIYIDLLGTEEKYREELGSAQTEEQSREVQTRMQLEGVEKLTKHGWTAERYVLVGEAIQADPNLTAKTLALIEARD